MLSFSSYLQQEEFMLQLAEELFREEELLEAIKSEEIRYKKDNGQFVAVSDHANERSKTRAWYSSFKDPKFIEFAEKTLTALRNWKRLPSVSSVDKQPIHKVSERYLDYNLGVCDKSQKYGWKIALQYSLNKEKSLDSCYVITVLNLLSGDMDKPKHLFYDFSKKGVVHYFINVDNDYSGGDNDSQLATLNIELEELQSKKDDAELEYEYEEDEKLKREKKKIFDKIVSQYINTKNRIDKLTKTVNESVELMKVTKDDREVYILMI